MEKISNYCCFSAGPSFKARLLRRTLLLISGLTKLNFCCFAEGFPEHAPSPSRVPQWPEVSSVPFSPPLPPKWKGLLHTSTTTPGSPNLNHFSESGHPVVLNRQWQEHAGGCKMTWMRQTGPQQTVKDQQVPGDGVTGKGPQMCSALWYHQSCTNATVWFVKNKRHLRSFH